jgi:hypothetical protein
VIRVSTWCSVVNCYRDRERMYVCLYVLALESVTGRAGLGGWGWMVALIDDCDDQMDAFWFLSGLKGWRL